MKLTRETATASILAVYFCPTCKTAYSTKDEAVLCSRTIDPPRYKVGDIITMDRRYTWHDPGQELWVQPRVKGGSLHGDRDSYPFLYVVTHVGPKAEVTRPSAFSNSGMNDHQTAYSLFTQAVGTREGKNGHHGWTADHTHHTIQGDPLPTTDPRHAPLLAMAHSAGVMGKAAPNLL